ncbi:MFS transporter [Xenorhabdus anantnagensis]|uniref:MFS transporter n=1 Tax=Xenorhabdus anantnagensis TaxID=3025875 RepID=A0ABT5LVV8_9GAMM|nr:MFS transporter [Xenorhabdus anantnagensis]MDC9598576.1 MFS transporter [Xenorhabdus anantnagensis]
MPIVIYIFTLCAFSIGFTEFISIGLASVLAEDLHATVAQVGLAVTFYAVGVVIGAPVLTALASNWSRKRLLLVSMLTFTIGNILAALSMHLSLLLAARLLSGLAHGVFFAVASSVATRLVAPERAGAALSLVFGGVTIAMALGVPAGTWMGTLLPWQWIFALIAICGLVGMLGVAYWMPLGAGNLANTNQGWRQLPTLFDRRLLAAACLPLLSYTGSFALYTFVTPLLLQVTHSSIQSASAILLAYGIGAAIGNVIGGRMTDSMGMDRASFWLLSGLAVVLAMIGLGQTYFPAMVFLVMALGLTTYGLIPPLQSRILGLAHRHRPEAQDIASGLNIAAFNAGVVMGSVLGAASLNHWGLISLAWVGFVIALLALITLLWQRSRPSMRFDNPGTST